MINSRLFIPIRDITQLEFIDAWKQEENTTGHELDKNALDRLIEHQNYTGLHYYLGTLTEDGFNALVLPWHDEGYKVSYGGEPFWNVVSKYSSGLSMEKDDPCFKRLRRILDELNEQLQRTDSLIETDYVLGRIYSNPDVALKGHYQGYSSDSLFVGNFHRFLGYGLLMRQSGNYRPVKVYYCGHHLST